MLNGLKWGVEQAQVVDCNEFMNQDSGEPLAYVKLAYFGGMTTIMVDPEDAKKFMALRGRMVKASGTLWVEHKRSGVKVKFELGEIVELKQGPVGK